MLKRLTVAPARIDTEDDRARLYLPAVPNTAHALAQFNDYQGNKEARAAFTNSEGSHISLKATASPASPFGSFGFGFWNEPEAEATSRPTASEAYVFLYSRAETAAVPTWQAVAWKDGQKIDSTDLVRLPPTDWHTYEFVWKPDALTFVVDGVDCLRVPPATRPLGFAIWMSNQAYVFSPQGQVSVEHSATTEPQWLEVKAIKTATG